MADTDFDSELREVFREEVEESLETLVQALDHVIVAGGGLAEALQIAMRTTHNVKGAARVAGFSAIEQLAHAMEDVLVVFRDQEKPLGEALCESLREGVVVIRQLVDGEAVEERSQALIATLTGKAKPKARGKAKKKKKKKKASSRAKTSVEVPSQAQAQDEVEVGIEVASPAFGTRRLGSVKVAPERLDHLMAFSGDFLSLHARMENRHLDLEAFRGIFEETRSDLPDSARLLVDALGLKLDGVVRAAHEELYRFSYLTQEFSAAIKQVRMQPLRDSVGQWRRTVDGVASELGRKVRLKTEVDEIEVDRQILDGLRDPMMHLLRNAVDHGIEPPEARVAKDKPSTGTVLVSAEVAGTMIAIDISDDGRGIDLEAVRRRGAEVGLIEAGEGEKEDRELLEMIFSPALTTAAQVSHLSGRGVGLDVVRGRLNDLGGHVRVVKPRLGGTTIRLVIPSTLVSTKGLLVRAGEITYALPIAHVASALQVLTADVKTTASGPMVQRSNEPPLSLRWLTSLMQAPRAPDPSALTVVVVSVAETRIGLVVDEVVGDSEFVTKPLPWNFSRLRGVVGATVLGDEDLAIVVDVPGLLHAVRQKEAGRTDAVRMPQPGRKPRILIVDDSVTSRTLERNILQAAGYDVTVAVDGEAGWEAMQAGSFDLVVSDVEMPRLDGFGLTRRIRAEFGDIPIILVTSLDRQEDIAEGAAAGADEYLPKGRFDQRILLEAIGRLL